MRGANIQRNKVLNLNHEYVKDFIHDKLII